MMEPMVATADDYLATLAAMVLLRSGCDNFPVDTMNLLRHMAKINRQGEAVSICKEESGYSVFIPEKIPLGRSLCASLVLGILLDRIGKPYRDDKDEKHSVFIFTCHLLCPRQVFRLADRRWASIAFLEDFLGMPRSLIKSLPLCPSCYVPKDMNIQLLSQLRQQYRSLYMQDRTNEIALGKYLKGYEDNEYLLEESPTVDTTKLQEAVDALIPEHVLTKGHPASLYIEYTEDFGAFSRQFGTLDLEILYKLVFEEEPPIPLFGGKPQKGAKDYATQMERYLSRESSARLSMANLLYQRYYRPEEPDILTASIRKLYEHT